MAAGQIQSPHAGPVPVTLPRVRAMRPDSLVGAGALRTAVPGTVFRDCASLAVLAVVTLVFFWPAVAHGIVAYENDTRIFYYPLFVRLAAALRAGELPLWSPDVFGGYPIFADGEAGALYPPHLLALLALPVETAFTWLRPLRFFQAAVFTYLFCRTVRVGRFGSLVGALSFAFGGFSIAQLHHTNISTAAIWLPLILAFGELALRACPRTRYLYAILAGVGFGLQGLIIHVQVVLMSVLTFAAFCGYRCIVGPVGAGGGPFRALTARLSPAARARLSLVAGRPLLAVGVVALAGATGVGLAAVQLLPLFELGTFSFRGAGVDYGFASQYSVPPVQLLSLVLPEFFVADGRYWGLWSRWEVFVYAGVAPLVLALFGAVMGARRLVLFFLAIGLASLAMALGEHAPYGIHRTLSALPGFSVLRAPGRFSYLVMLSVAMLAALGADAITRELRHREPVDEPRGRTRCFSAWGPVLFTTLLLLVQLVAVAAPIALTLAGTFVETHKDEASAWLQATFMRRRGFDPRWSQEQLYQALVASLDVVQPATLRQLGLLAGTASVLLAWDRLRTVRPLWQGLLVLLIAVDLVAAGRTFHPAVPYDQLQAPSGLARYLAGQPGRYRVFTQKGARDEPNRLLSYGIAEANGYSSLEPDRHTHVAQMAEYAPNRLLDLMNVRYYAVRNLFEGLPSFNLTSFNPRRPLVSSTGRNPAGTASFTLDNTPASVVRVVSTMRWATAVPQGTDVAEITAVEVEGREHRFRLKAGVHTAEWAWKRPDLQGKVAHQLPPVARTWEQRDGRAQPYQAHFYFGEFPLPGSVRLRRLDVQFLHPTAQVEIYGLASFDDNSKELEQLGLERLSKFKRVYADEDVIVYENQNWLPRAYLVPSAVIEMPSSEIVTRMAQGDFSPERMVILEEQFDLTRLPPPIPAETPVAPITFDRPQGTQVTSAAGTVHLLRVEPELLRLDASATQPAMLFLADLAYPGWRAYLDGKETPIYRANYIFRAIYVPAGQHTVEFIYRPRSFRLGLLLTLISTVFVLGALVLLTVGTPLLGRFRSAWLRSRARGRRWQHVADGDTMDSSGSVAVSMRSADGVRGVRGMHGVSEAANARDVGGKRRSTVNQKGPMSNGRQESEGDAEEESAEGGGQDQEGGAQVAAARGAP
ncbi:MAG: Serine phosphatase RsbU, regulator of sigma subunit [uncultured Chloroflexi bacterium]|uniref:Serine phosphatase RsbU, regulator of sigma subunit n=1 Tax=uncultured Chloroflexota bacterium TaxID=166587 RepID=A0A6J4K3L9_9CHLR|nr:MAG: Serine phosphatase RsbU, regulator of sigma subunit [uncultured Chloroflexota bacterium]